MAAGTSPKGTRVFVLTSGNEGGRGLVARGIVTSAVAVDEIPGAARQPPA